MKRFWESYRPVILLFIAWRLLLAAAEYVSPYLFPLRDGFLGLYSPWANMDGEHYLSIANVGYQQYNVAFFPVYPFLMRWLNGPEVQLLTQTGIIISHVSFLLALLVFYTLLKARGEKIATWSVVFLLAFPTSFYFAAVYSESVFFLFAILSVYCIFQKRLFLGGIFGMLSSATRLFGIFLIFFAVNNKRIIKQTFFLIPLGLIFYVIYLYALNGDPLAFLHVQPVFGAGRSGNAIIFPPQVLYRYVKIALTVQFNAFVYWIAMLELITFAGSLYLLWIGLKEKMQFSYILYSASIILVPTLTGTFSSLPRYVLSAFPLFIILGSMHNRMIKYALVFVFVVLQFLLAAAYLRGYFVA